MKQRTKYVFGFLFVQSFSASGIGWMATNTHPRTRIWLRGGARFRAEIQVSTGHGSSVAFVAYDSCGYTRALVRALEQARQFGRGLR